MKPNSDPAPLTHHLPDFLTAFLTRHADRLLQRAKRFAVWRSGAPGYVFTIDTDPGGLRLYADLLARYRRYPGTRFGTVAVADIPGLALALRELPRTEVHNFTLFVLHQMTVAPAGPDPGAYKQLSALLRQLLDRRPWASETQLQRLTEALYFLSPAGHDGVVYWPLTTFLRSVRAGYGGRRPSAGVARVLDLMLGELRNFFHSGYTAEATRCQDLLLDILLGLPAPAPPAEVEPTLLKVAV